MKKIVVDFMKLDSRAEIPVYQSSQAAGADLHALLDEVVVLNPGEIGIIPTGIAVALPVGYEGQIRPRSGLAAKHGVTVLNSPGTIDSDYRGELQIILINHGQEPFSINHGERIAQFVLARHETADFTDAAEFSQTERGKNKFGSTGR